MTPRRRNRGVAVVVASIVVVVVVFIYRLQVSNCDTVVRRLNSGGLDVCELVYVGIRTLLRDFKEEFIFHLKIKHTYEKHKLELEFYS